MSASGEILRVDLGDRSYDVVIGCGLFAEGGCAGGRIREAAGGGRCWIVTDETLAALHLDGVLSALSAAGVDAAPVVLPPGEPSKTMDSVGHVVDAVLDGAPERTSAVVALGGGVVGDIAGFAASMVLRGVRFIQLPTTLLAQVDSAIGGKTGVNAPQGKNLIGAFHQPHLVLADSGFLDTLPERELLAGYAEVVKYALIGDAAFLAWLEGNAGAVLSGDADARRHAVHVCCSAKAEVVGRDEREAGVRALLNFGHTFGHALEAGSGYTLLHGEAVAVGMVLALELSAALGLCGAEDVERVRGHFLAVGLPVRIPPEAGRDPQALVEHMRRDKKVRAGRIAFVLARGIGDVFVTTDVDTGDVLRVLRGAMA